MERNAFSEEEASRWIDNQLPLSEKEAIADAVIRNDGDIDGLRHAVREAWMELGLPSAQ
jgi:dephospho-CoA kinase